MIGYIIRRLLQSVVVIIGVTMLVFGMEHLIPGGAGGIARAILGPRANPVTMHAWEKENGYLSPVW